MKGTEDKKTEDGGGEDGARLDGVGECGGEELVPDMALGINIRFGRKLPEEDGL